MPFTQYREESDRLLGILKHQAPYIMYPQELIRACSPIVSLLVRFTAQELCAEGQWQCVEPETQKAILDAYKKLYLSCASAPNSEKPCEVATLLLANRLAVAYRFADETNHRTAYRPILFAVATLEAFLAIQPLLNERASSMYAFFRSLYGSDLTAGLVNLSRILEPTAA